MDNEVFAVFLGNQRMGTVRTFETDRGSNLFTTDKSLTTDFALILTISPIVVIDVMMRGTTQRTNGIIRNGFTISALNRFFRLAALPLVIFEKALPILFDKGLDDGKLVNFKFLKLGRMGIIEILLLERDISANKI